MDVLTRPSLLDRLFGTRRALVVWLIASLVCNMGIIVTGAIVRLTASGLGCPTWPRCTDDSYVPVPEQGVHGLIEFGNRLLTFVLIIAAVGAAVAAFRATQDRLLRIMTIGIGIGIPFQGVIGGLTVWSGLNPFVVALHLLLSVALIVACTWTVLRGKQAEPTPVPPLARLGVVATFVLAMIAIWIGTVVTGSGPHSGDHGAARTGFNIETVARFHGISAWLLLGATIATLVLLHRANAARPRRAAMLLLAAVLIQGVIGYAQYLDGLPIWLVTLHMVGITLITLTASLLLFTTRRAVA